MTWNEPLTHKNNHLLATCINAKQLKFTHQTLYQTLSNTQGAFTSQKNPSLMQRWNVMKCLCGRSSWVANRLNQRLHQNNTCVEIPCRIPFSMKLWRFHLSPTFSNLIFSFAQTNLSRSSRLIYAYVSQGLASNPATPWIFMFERIKKIGIIDMVSQPQEPSIKVRSKSSRKGGLLTEKQTISRNNETNLTRGTAL